MSGTKIPRRRKAPRNTEWRGETLHGRIRIKGKLRRWSLRTGDVKLARKLVAEDIARLRSAVYHDGARVKYRDIVASWAERHILDAVGPRTAHRYAVSLKQIEPFLIDLYIDEIDKAKIGEIVMARRAAGVSIATIKRDLTALASVLAFAEIEDDPIGAWLRPGGRKKSRLKERRDPIVLPEHPHIERVLARAVPAIGAIAQAALLTGCRQEELVTAEVGRLDHVRKELTVIGKGNKLRVVSLSAAAYDHLRRLPHRLGCKWLFWQEDGGPLRDVSGRFYKTAKAEEKAAGKAAAAAGHDHPDFRRMTFHHLRHRYAVDYLRNREGTIRDLQKQLGHESVVTTELYLKFLTPEEAVAAMHGSAPAPAAAQVEQKGA
jgi:integrase/recombinase XerD